MIKWLDIILYNYIYLYYLNINYIKLLNFFSLTTEEIIDFFLTHLKSLKNVATLRNTVILQFGGNFQIDASILISVKTAWINC